MHKFIIMLQIKDQILQLLHNLFQRLCDDGPNFVSESEDVLYSLRRTVRPAMADFAICDDSDSLSDDDEDLAAGYARSCPPPSARFSKLPKSIRVESASDEDEEWESLQLQLRQKSKMELMRIIMQIEEDAYNRKPITDEYVHQLLRRKFVSPYEQIPKITINRRFELYLVNEEVVLPLSPQMRALYLLFLFNPGGIRITKLECYRQQFSEIYRLLTTRSDYQSVVDNIFDESDPNHRNFHSLRSNVNRVISSKFVDIEMAETFKISSTTNGVYSIRVPQENIIIPAEPRWEAVKRAGVGQ